MPQMVEQQQPPANCLVEKETILTFKSIKKQTDADGQRERGERSRTLPEWSSGCNQISLPRPFAFLSHPVLICELHPLYVGASSAFSQEQ